MPIIESYIALIARILARISVNVTGDGIKLRLEPEEDHYRGSIDERIAKIDAAKANLLEGLKAIDKLKESAENNKKRLKLL